MQRQERFRPTHAGIGLKLQLWYQANLWWKVGCSTSCGAAKEVSTQYRVLCGITVISCEGQDNGTLQDKEYRTTGGFQALGQGCVWV